MEWHSDVAVESRPLDTTGGHTWSAARRLAEFCRAEAAGLGLRRPGVSLLELGAGTGWLGLTLARNMPHARLLCLTEQPDGLDHLESNVQLNRQRLGLPLEHVQVEACDWRGYAASPPAEAAAGTAGSSSLAATDWDFIVGSDLVYTEVGSRCLPRVLAALAGPACTVLYSHTKHRLDLLDAEFFQQLTACGLSWEEVWEAGVPPRPPSPPPQFPPADLFPEQRIAVFCIRKVAAAARQEEQQPAQCNAAC